MYRPLILISNDDGYEAKGLHVLTELAREYGDVVVVAPDGGRSGAALSVTFQRVLTSRLIKEEPGLKVYACNGTPCDCVKLGLAQYCDRKPDLVLGGINHGDNSAVNVHYSGTMGVVIEGCLKGIPSIGFSHCSHNMDTDFEPMIPYMRRVIDYVLKNGLQLGIDQEGDGRIVIVPIDIKFPVFPPPEALIKIPEEAISLQEYADRLPTVYSKNLSFIPGGNRTQLAVTKPVKK